MGNPRAGDFFLAPISGIGGFGVKVGQWLNGDGFLKIQHAGIYLGDGATIEAMPGGAISDRISRFKPESLVWSTDIIDLTDEQRVAIVAEAENYLGVPYSGLDYLALAAHRFHIPTPHLKRYIESSGHMICSQLVDWVYSMVGVQLFDDGRWPGYVTPGDLDELLRIEKFHKLSMGL